MSPATTLGYLRLARPEGRRAARASLSPAAVGVARSPCYCAKVLTEVDATRLETARWLLAHESTVGDPAARAAASGRVYDKLETHLAPLLGSAGVRVLLVRSARLASDRFPFLDGAVVETSGTLRDCLQAQDAAIAGEAAATLFGTFLALLAKFIGERLTTQALRRAWPTIEKLGSTNAETKKT